jgi:spore cortex biosynthesis protein YabQ
MWGQGAAFLATAGAGAVLGILYDCFRIFRKVLRHKTAVTAIEDAVFWIISTLLMFVFLLDRNFGDIRAFIFMGLALGAILYFAVLSRFFTKFAMAVLRWAKRVLLVIISPIIIVSGTFKKRLKFGQRYVKIKGRRIYQRVKRRWHEGQGSTD